MGSFVPAEFSQIGIADRIFTRVGASDDLHSGQSTFMLEMIETANITKYATSKSLVILDEIGRGTNTQEGLSIAWAVAEYLHDKIKAKTLFATHFYELTKLPEILKSAKNYQIAVKESQDKVIFLHKIIPGKSKSSFALYVAHLAGLNKEIIKRAGIILEEKEIENFKKTNLKDDRPAQITFREFKSEYPLYNEILSLTLDEITPIEALNKIYRWQKNLRAEKL
ncbi:MAG: hypothetical protein HYU63_01735 [Armatimonadetes bacterium]|nr:hypothetical protein [Armatimonadota bacterium]